MERSTTPEAPSPSLRPLVHVPDLCILLGRTRHTVHRMIRAGSLPPPIYVSARPAWEPEVIEGWLRERRAAANAKREQGA